MHKQLKKAKEPCIIYRPEIQWIKRPGHWFSTL